MKRLLLCTCLIAAAAALPTGTALATGGASGISRCATPEGVTVYTDAACGDLGARSAPMSETLVRTLAREGTNANIASVPAGALPGFTGASGRPVGDKGRPGCPRTPDQLHAAFQDSVAQGDVNELAAIYDWTDVSGRQSRELLKRLERISRSRVEDVSFASNGIRRRAGCLLLAL
jgi:hypothetical protein